MKNKCKIIIIGGGLGGLWATMRIAEAGHHVNLFSLFEVKRSHSACAQGGINASLNTKGEDDSVWQHIVDTIKGGDYLAHQPPIKNMCERAPGLIYTFDRMGVTFSRTPEGLLDQRLFGGVKNRRTAFAGSSTGQQLLYACDEQVRKYESSGRVTKYEWWEFLSLVLDSNSECKGITALNLKDLSVHSFKADVVILATGGLGLIYGKSTNSINSTGAAASRVYQQGAKFVNGEFIQFHPTAIPGNDKNRLMSEASRGEGGRIWVSTVKNDQRKPIDIPKEERFYFLEEWYPAYGNTVPRDIASRSIWKVIHERGLGFDGKVCLDLTHLPNDFLASRLGSIMNMYEKYVGEDPFTQPMLIAPAAHYSMGGLWINWEKDENTGSMKMNSPINHATNIPGVFACGECDGGYHGANRLGANSLLSASFSGLIVGESIISFSKNLKESCEDSPESIFENERKHQSEINRAILKREKGENPFILHKQLGDVMTRKVGIVRKNQDLDDALNEISDIKGRAENICINDSSEWSNTSLQFARQVKDMTILGEVIARSARMRDECRGSHYKPEFEIKIPEGKFEGDPEYDAYIDKWDKNNEKWLKMTTATHVENSPQISYEPIDVSILEPSRPRDYR